MRGGTWLKDDNGNKVAAVWTVRDGKKVAVPVKDEPAAAPKPAKNEEGD